jgi:hypothetical protein
LDAQCGFDPREDVKGRGIANCSKFASAPRDNRISFRRIIDSVHWQKALIIHRQGFLDDRN